jgi:ABC-type multidrug transport system fused ATPase/permease subunit
MGTTNHSLSLRVPRPFSVLVAYSLLFILLSPFAIFLVPVILAPFRDSIPQNYVADTATVIMLIILFILLYALSRVDLFLFPFKGIVNAIIDREENILSVANKRAVEKRVNLNDVRGFLLKRIAGRLAGMGAVQYILMMERRNAETAELFCDDYVLGCFRWELFAKRLSIYTGIPLRKETWVENYEGKLFQIQKPKLESITQRYLRRVIIFVPSVVSILFAMVFNFEPTVERFIILACLSVLVNLLFMFVYISTYRKYYLSDSEEQLNHLGAFLRIIITSSLTSYALFALLIYASKK